MLKGAGEVILNIQNTYQSSHDGNYTIGKDQESIQITKTTKINTNLTDIDYQRFWDSIKVTVMTSDGELAYKRLGELTTNALTNTITLNNVSANPYATILQFFTTKETAKFIKTKLGQYDLKVLDQVRDVILHKKGNETLTIAGIS